MDDYEMKTRIMKIKIGTFGFILKNPKFDKDRMVSDLVNSEFEKRYYKFEKRHQEKH